MPLCRHRSTGLLTVNIHAFLQKEYTFPAKRLVFEDLSSPASGESEKDEKIKALNAEVAELKKRVLTALADVENMRTRMKKTAEDDKKFAVRSFAKGAYLYRADPFRVHTNEQGSESRCDCIPNVVSHVRSAQH